MGALEAGVNQAREAKHCGISDIPSRAKAARHARGDRRVERAVVQRVKKLKYFTHLVVHVVQLAKPRIELAPADVAVSGTAVLHVIVDGFAPLFLSKQCTSQLSGVASSTGVISDGRRLALDHLTFDPGQELHPTRTPGDANVSDTFARG